MLEHELIYYVQRNWAGTITQKSATLSEALTISHAHEDLKMLIGKC